MQQRTIICRFADQESLNKLQQTLPQLQESKEYNIDTQEIIKEYTKPKSKQIKTTPVYYDNMPQFKSKKVEAYRTIKLITSKDKEELSRILEQNITEKTQSIWFPKLQAGSTSTYRVLGGKCRNKFPIYVVSKGRPQLEGTSKYLSRMEVYHYIILEEQDLEEYKKHNTSKYLRFLILPDKYKKEYDVFWEDDDPRTGPGPARNFAWEHSMQKDYKWHWVMDDNATEGFHWIYQNNKIKVRTGAFFRALEDFTLNINNIAIAGLNYTKFVKSTDKVPPYVHNTRIYSFLLIRNDIDYRWRGRYNEDTDLSLRVLKDGWNTIQYNVFTAGKATTQTNTGGNTEEFYAQEGTSPKSQMLKDMHPDDVSIVYKFHRCHHSVNYKKYQRPLCFKTQTNKGDNNYGMYLVNTQEKETKNTKTFLEEKYKNYPKELPKFYSY